MKKFVLTALFVLMALTTPTTASAATFHYCSGCYMAWQQEREGSDRHSYVLNYGRVVSSGSGWVGVRAHNVNHNSFGLNAQNWGTSTHSYSGNNLLFMIVGNIYDNGVGNWGAVSDNAHGNY